MFWVRHGSEYARSSYLFVRLLKIPQVLNAPGFWIWHSCICKGYTEFWICVNMLQYTLMFLSMPKHGLILLNDLKYTQKCLSSLCWLCQSSEYASLSERYTYANLKNPLYVCVHIKIIPWKIIFLIQGIHKLFTRMVCLKTYRNDRIH